LVANYTSDQDDVVKRIKPCNGDGNDDDNDNDNNLLISDKINQDEFIQY
jgi:hypothetical protein